MGRGGSQCQVQGVAGSTSSAEEALPSVQKPSKKKKKGAHRSQSRYHLVSDVADESLGAKFSVLERDEKSHLYYDSFQRHRGSLLSKHILSHFRPLHNISREILPCWRWKVTVDMARAASPATLRRATAFPRTADNIAQVDCLPFSVTRKSHRDS